MGIESGQFLPIWVFIGFIEKDDFDKQTRKNSAFNWLHVSSAVCKLGKKGILILIRVLIVQETIFRIVKMEDKISFSSTLKIE